jgi:UDP-N-acetylmuramoyl-tripeptide--D-alanyl-D-alanine ligase
MISSVREFADLCGGRYSGVDHACSGVNTDTRTLRPGEVYLALRGPRFDGNEFLGAAAAAGAVAAVVDRPVVMHRADQSRGMAGRH